MELVGLVISLFLVCAFWATVISGEARSEGAFWLWVSMAAHFFACLLIHRQWLWMQRNPGGFLRFYSPARGARSTEFAQSDAAWICTLALLVPVLAYNLSGPKGREIATPNTVQPQLGDLADTGGSPTIREDFAWEEDDPDTSNDESNDQPLGHFGTETLSVFSHDSSNYYILDGDIEDGALERLYFPKGGWIDFYSCDLDEDLEGDCVDEEGRLWSIEGEG
jgi:hypothetical protein